MGDFLHDLLADQDAVFKKQKTSNLGEGLPYQLFLSLSPFICGCEPPPRSSSLQIAVYSHLLWAEI